MQVCPNCGEELPAKFRLCGFCGASLALALPAQEVRKSVTVVFSDLTGSTSLGESLDSEALREVMSRYFDVMRSALERHGGTIEKFIGDAVMAVFGLPKLHEDDALRAVRAAAEMQRALAELNEEIHRVWGVTLTNRTGVNTGEVVAGDPAAGQRLVTGDAVNVAARLEQAAPAMEVLLGELTYQLVRDAVEVEPVEPLELKGKAERVPAYRLLSVAERGEGRTRRGDTPMVGRDAELGVLFSAFEESAGERTCRLVTVVADAGVGKSRLNEEFLRAVGDRATVLRGRCLSYSDGITFWPLVEAMRQAAGIREDDSSEEAVARLRAIAGSGGDDAVDRVAAAIGLTEQQFPIDELFWGARRLLEDLAQEAPLVVLFDDIHWAAPTLLDLIEYLLEAVEDAPILLLCPSRHELLEHRPDWAHRDRATRIVLDPLSEPETERIVENLLGAAGIAEEARRQIATAAEGNPLYAEQLLSMLIDKGMLREEEGHWASTRDLADLAVPPSIHALLAARIDNLVPEERAVLEAAAVIGVSFPRDALEELAPQAIRPGVAVHVERLARKQFVRPDVSGLDEERFRFNHVLIREAAYRGVLKRVRAALHERFVVWADRVNRERGRETEYEEILGHHLEAAHCYLAELGPLDDHGIALGRSAATRLASAGRRAFARGDVPAAVNLFRRAVALLPERDTTRIELLPDHGEALLQTGRYDEAEAVLDAAIEQSGAAGLPRVRSSAALIRLFVRLRAGDSPGWRDDVEVVTTEAIGVFEPAADHAGLAKAWRLRAFRDGVACNYAAAADASARALEHARLAGDARQASRLSVNYSQAALFGPTPVADGIAHCEEIAAHVTGDRQSEAMVLAPLASLLAMNGQFERARDCIARSAAFLDELGLHAEAARTRLESWRVETLAGDLEAAERALRQAYEIVEASGDRYVLSTVAGLLGMAVYALERYEEASLLARQAMQLAPDDDIDSQALWRCIRGRVLARQGEFETAEAHVRQALALLENTDAMLFKLDALLDLAEVQRVAGREAAASASLASALELAILKGSPVMEDTIRALLPDESSAPMAS